MVCKEEIELLKIDCLEIHKKIFPGDQQFKDSYGSIEYCSKGNKGLKCNTLI